MGGYAWVTLATNDSYSLGALVLAHSLRRVGTQHDLAVLITPGVTASMREKLSSVFTLVREVNVLDSKDEANLAVLQRPELGITFTKLHCWRLTQYEKCVFIDADALVVRNCDELFEREELSAAPDVGWPDCFNSGVFVFRPSQQTFASITTFAASQGSFDGADQGLLNMYFSDWAHKDISKHLPFIYNMCSTATYSYAPAFKQYGENVRIIHFIGATKPWLQYFDTLTGIVQPPSGCNHLQPLLQIWWNIFCDNVHPQLTDVMAASNMTTIWYESNSFSTNPNTCNYISHQYNPDQDSYSEIHSGPPDFSEFKDPWENYIEHIDPFTKNVEQLTDDDKQYYCNTNTHYTEPLQLISHNQCGAEPPSPPSSSSSSHQHSDHHQIDSSLHSSQSFLTSQQESFSFENELNQKFMENYHAPQRLSEQQNSTDESEAGAKWICENLDEIAALCDFIEQVHHESKDHNHRTDHKNTHQQDTDHHFNHDNQIEQSNYTVVEPSTSTASILHESRQSSIEKNDREHKQTDQYNPSSSNALIPCTDPNNVATQSELSASPCIENAEGGLAGALSKLTMGESRSDEQKAIEDHMRKQNWEQGHIDFMGRDSFDNILKKINETLASAPPRQPSPIKETRQPKKSSSKSSEVEAAVEESEVALPVLATEDQAEGSSKETCQRLSSSEVTASPSNDKLQHVEPSSVAAVSEADNTSCEQISILTQGSIEAAGNTVPITQHADVSDNTEQLQEAVVLPGTPAEAILNIKKIESLASEPIEETQVPEETKQILETVTVQQQVTDNTTEALSDTAVLTALISSTTPETKPVEVSMPIQVPTHIVSEATTECPVPIQVAESVLQAEPKESVSEDPRPVIEAVVSSIIPPVQESAAAVSETLIEPGEIAPTNSIGHPQQLNGDDSSLQQKAVKVLPSAVTSTALISRSPNVVSVVHEFAPIAQHETLEVIQENKPVQAQIQENKPVQAQPQSDLEPLPKPEDTSSSAKLEEFQSSSVSEETPEMLVSQKTKLTVKLPQAESSEVVASETQCSTVDQQETAIDSAASTVLPSEDSPVRPTRSKDLKIPGTPIVIGPTPPTSPPLDSEAIQAAREESQKQAQSVTEEQVSAENQVKVATETKIETPVESKVKVTVENEVKTPAEEQAVTSTEARAEVAVEEQVEAEFESQSESQETTKKIVKKIVKKSSAESDTPSSPESEGSGKKLVKKVVKKVVKKTKEGEEAEGSSSVDKPKKVVKTVKKVVKTSSSTSLETDKTVPETPPPSESSEAPVPPKRKAKSTSGAKVSSKKPDES